MNPNDFKLAYFNYGAGFDVTSKDSWVGARGRIYRGCDGLFFRAAQQVTMLLLEELEEIVTFMKLSDDEKQQLVDREA